MILKRQEKHVLTLSIPILQMHDWVTSASTTTPATMATEAPQGPIDRN